MEGECIRVEDIKNLKKIKSLEDRIKQLEEIILIQIVKLRPR